MYVNDRIQEMRECNYIVFILKIHLFNYYWDTVFQRGKKWNLGLFEQ